MKKIKFRTKFYLIIFIFIYLLLNFYKTNLVFAMQNNSSKYIIEKDFLNESFFNDEASSSSFNQNTNYQEIDLNLSLKLPENTLSVGKTICLQFTGVELRSLEEIQRDNEIKRKKDADSKRRYRLKNMELLRKASRDYYSKNKDKIKLKRIEKSKKIINND
mgnify:CR=1 FL=1